MPGCEETCLLLRARRLTCCLQSDYPDRVRGNFALIDGKPASGRGCNRVAIVGAAKSAGARGILFAPIVERPSCSCPIPNKTNGLPAIKLPEYETSALRREVESGKTVTVELFVNDYPCREVWR